MRHNPVVRIRVRGRPKKGHVADRGFCLGREIGQVCGIDGNLMLGRWASALAAALHSLHKSTRDIARDRKSAHWKLAIAARLKRGTDASNQWLATHLNLGTPAAFSHNLSLFRRR